MLIGMWQPGRHPVEIEHVFVPNSFEGLSHAAAFLERVRPTARRPLVTVEPWAEMAEAAKRWADVFAWHDRTVHVRYMHEMNGTWYPWGNDPERFRREWARWTAAMPPNVRNVACFNVAYDGMPHALTQYFVEADVIGIDGYARNGETPAELFRPTMEEMFGAGVFRHNRPFWICETAAPRGRKQARYAGALRAFAEQQGIEAVVWMNEDKAHLGGDERDWSLTKGAARALLGRGK